MRLEHYPLKKLKKEITDITNKHLDTKNYKIFFFGSRVNGKGDEYSDIDIGIEGSKKLPWQAISNIKEDIENLPTLYKIDFIDFKSVNKQFYDFSIKNIETI